MSVCNITSISNLPLDIVDRIVTALWTSPLTPSERVHVTKSFQSVSRAWSALFTRIFYVHFHLCGPSRTLKFLQILRGSDPLTLNMLNRYCRSITFEHAHEHLFPRPSLLERPLGPDIDAILRHLASFPQHLPLLDRVSFHLHNYLMETLFDLAHFQAFPTRVRCLEFQFSYSPRTDGKAIQQIKSTRFERFGIYPGSMPHVRELRVFGSSTAVAKELLAACGGMGTLDVFEQDAWIPSTACQPFRPNRFYEKEQEEQQEEDDGGNVLEHNGYEPEDEDEDDDDDLDDEEWEAEMRSYSSEDLSCIIATLRGFQG
ncbi:hypothetical protein Moror_14070 [Moniliophthora roreri MCA 2997]|uniref:Uncharacterized protein n=2 Tax=Moniliophthora roreri TaxID=221103 RepID=V2X6V9_MONRO|nr:hypothetical protein Moror_14070 [Moniliophthora roreri MCA 2997]